MSKNFNKNNLKEIFSELTTESSINLPQYLNIKNVSGQKGGDIDITSSFLPQKGGSFSATSSANKHSNNEVNQLISMLTSESNDKHNFSANSTATEDLENRLRNMLQNGGAKKKSSKKQKGGSASNDDLKNCCNMLKNAGINVKLDNLNCSDYFNNLSNKEQTTKIEEVPRNNVEAPSVMKSLNISDTSTVSNDVFIPNISALVPSATSTEVPSATSTEVPTTQVASATSTEVPTNQVLSATSTNDNVFTSYTNNKTANNDLLTQTMNTVGSAAEAIGNAVGTAVTSVAKTVGLIDSTPENKTPENKTLENKIGGAKKSKKHSKK